MPQTEDTSAAVVGGCAKVTQFLVGLNLLGRGGESCGCAVSIHEEYVTVPVEREARYPAPVWWVLLFLISFNFFIIQRCYLNNHFILKICFKSFE